MLLTLGIIAGFLQALGYLLYITKSLKDEVEPNPTTWLMFAYGTTLLTVLECNSSARWEILLLPITCAVMGVVVAIICAYRGTLKYPEAPADRISFGLDIFLTFLYVLAWYLRKSGMLSEHETQIAIMVFLVASNIGAFTAFTPILRETYHDPAHEHFAPWVVWTLAYVSLGFGTYLEHGVWSDLMLYPVINAPLHAAVAWLSRPCRKARRAVG